jgi:hydrazine synthase alpha subunit-like protein
MSVKHHIQSIAIGAALFTLGSIGCGGGDGENSGPLSSIDALVILQRPKRNDTGDIFQYTSYVPGARLVKLSPPTADGTLTTLCCDKAGPEFKNVDISGYDLSFDAKSIVFSGKLSDNQNYGLFLLQLADGSVTQIATDPQRDYVSPIFLPGDRVMFMSNAVVEAGAHQHRDEYERGITTQLGRVDLDGSHLELGPRNLSHRTAPSLASDGRVIFTQWDHLGPENSGHLMFVNQDMQELREGFGKEGKGASNSTLKAVEISAGRYIGIATARNRTLNAGALIDIRLGVVENHDGVVSAPTKQSEANSTYVPLTPDVPIDNVASAPTVGRYYDAYPLNAKDKPDLLVSWADGPVESGFLSMAGQSANFGIYLYDSAHQQRRPILDDSSMWDIFARPLATRSAPNIVGSAQDPKLAGQTLIGSLDVYQSTLHTFNRPAVGAPGEIYGVRVMEGFSSEEGFPEMFGTTMFEGHANLGVAPLASDNKSWSAKVPANIPIHLQAVDKFGMSIFNEPVWFSGRSGEARMCGGCHEDRTQTTTVSPGLLDTFATGASQLFATTPRESRLNNAPAQATDIVGVGWTTQVQPIFSAKCVSCHDGTNNGKNPSYTITDKAGATMTWYFNLKPDPLPAQFAVVAGGAAYSSSYFTMAGPDMEAIEKGGFMLSPDFKVYMNPEDAHGSIVIQTLNPTTLFPAPDANRAFPGQGHLKDQGIATDLTSKEFYMLILACDMGVNFYARENNPMLSIY